MRNFFLISYPHFTFTTLFILVLFFPQKTILANTSPTDTEALSVSIVEVNHVSCFGESDANVTVLAMGGSGNYTYLWSDGQTGATASDLSVGLISVTVTDTDDGATAQTNTIITYPEPLLATIIVESNITCANAVGNAIVVVTGGTQDYTYLWDNGETGATAINLDLGEHSVTVTDAHGCITTDIANIYEDTVYPIADAGQDLSIDCNNPNPLITLDGSNSTQGLTISYLWFTSDGTIVADPTSLDPQVNGTGTYTILVTNNENNCASVDDVIIGSSFEEPVADAGDDVVICVGECVTITANATQGDTPYTYGWDQGLGLGQSFDVCPVATTIYTVTITGANGCRDKDAVKISVAPTPSLDLINDTICQGECITLVPIANYSNIVSYEWSNGSTNQFEFVCPSETSDYSLTIYDINGCSNTAEVTIVVNDIPHVEINDVSLCDGQCIDINATAEGGTGTFSYLWSNGDTTTFINICPDESSTYYVSITDANGCEAVDSAYAFVNTELIIAPEDDYIVCEGAETSICVTTTGGTPPYVYEWSGIGNGTSNCIMASPGTYAVTVTDSIGCTASTQVSISAIPAPTITLPDVEICAGECITLSPVVSGTAPPFTYQWSTGSTSISETVCPDTSSIFSFTVTDAIGCQTSAMVTVNILSLVADAGDNFTLPCFGPMPVLMGNGSSQGSNIIYLWTTADGSITNGANTVNPEIESTGNYILTLTDTIIGCTAVDSVLVSPAEMPSINVDEIGLISCNGDSDGFINISISGATSPYTFNWSNGATTEDIANLSPGVYALTVIDAGACESTISVELLNPPPLNVNISLSHESAANANDGVIAANAAGGTPTYNYLWNTGASTNILTNLVPGFYTLTLTDAHGCQTTETVQILAHGCDTMDIISSNNAPICIESNEGIIEISQVLGGQVPYSYLWSSGNTTNTAQNLSAGSVLCTVTDANGCEAVFSFEITESDTIAPIVVIQDINVFLDENGMASFIFDSIDNGSSDNCQIDSIYIENTQFDCSQLGENTIEVIVFDKAMLSDTAFVVVSVLDTLPPIFDFCPANIESNNCLEVIYEIPAASDNCMEVLVELSQGLPSGSTFPEGETNIEYIATDASGNVTFCQFTITVINDLVINLLSIPETDMNADGAIKAEISGGTNPYTFEWTDADGTVIGQADSLTNLVTGTYCLLVTDNNGCTQMQCILVDRLVPTQYLDFSEKITIAPNPVSGTLFIHFDVKINDDIEIQLINTAGQQVLKRTKTAHKNDLQLDVSHLSSGLYVLKIIIGDKLFIEEIVVK